MRRVLSSLLLGLVLAGLATASPRGNTSLARQVRVLDGKYAVAVRGYYSGFGVATVTATNVRIDAEVQGLDGSSGRLQIDMPVHGPYFSGAGTLPSGAVMINGRLDAPKASRLVCTYRGSSLSGEPARMRSGRIAGILPTDTGDVAWDDEQHTE